MKELEIRRQAKQFCRGLLGNTDTDSKCFITSIALTSYLNTIGVECTLKEGFVKGHHHFWIGLPDGKIIDATADQFTNGNDIYPNLFVSKPPGYYVEKK